MRLESLGRGGGGGGGWGLGAGRVLVYLRVEARQGQGQGPRRGPQLPEAHARPPQRLQERKEAAHRPEQGGERWALLECGGGIGRGLTLRCGEHLHSPPQQDFVEVCKREGGDPEKGVDRLLGLGSSRCGTRGSLGAPEIARAWLLGAPHCQPPRWTPARVVWAHHFSREAWGWAVLAVGVSVGVCLTMGGSHPRPRSGSAGRVALSREDKEAAKLGLSVFTVTTPKHPGIPWWGGGRSECLFLLRAMGAGRLSLGIPSQLLAGSRRSVCQGAPHTP